MTREELIAQIAPGAYCVEVGVCEGEFSAVIMQHNPAGLILIDAWEHFPEGYDDPANVDQGGQDARYRRVCERFWKDVAVSVFRNRSNSPLVELFLKSRVFIPDWIYIDANHSYYAVLADARFYARFTNKLLFHDYLPDDNALGFGVRKAVQQFLAENPEWKISLVTDEDFPTVVIEK